jgi:Fe-S cluster biogenesis protein NfuA
VTDRSVFQDQIRQLGKLITQFDQMPEGPQRVACKELVQLLMDVHGAGLERVMEIVFEDPASGRAIVDKLARDSVVSSLLVLYSLHPDDLETRVRKAVDQMLPRLRKLSCNAEIVRIDEGAVQLQVTTTGHSCGSSAKDLHAIVEDVVYEFAPDVVSLEILGLDEPSTTGFVALESLMGHNLVIATPNGHSPHAEGTSRA